MPQPHLDLIVLFFTMASFGNHLSLFFLLVLLLLMISPQIQAREAKFFSHLRTKEPQFVLTEAKTPATASVPTTTIAATPAFAPEFRIVGPGPAPEAFFLDRGDGYGLYGTPSDPTGYSSTNTNFENELLNEDLNGESYKTGHQSNGEEHRSNFNNVNEHKYNNYYDGKREGKSDTRFVENGKYYYDVKNENENYSNVNFKGYDSTENELGYFDKNKYPNEYNTMEEYEKEQQSQGYIP